MAPMVQHKLFFVQENFADFIPWQQKTANFLLKINCYQEVKIALTRDVNLQRLLKNQGPAGLMIDSAIAISGYSTMRCHEYQKSFITEILQITDCTLFFTANV